MMPPEMVHPGTGRAYMAAPSYATACQSCHALQFDRYFSESVPHDKPQVVHDFIVSKLTEYIKKHPDSLGVGPRPVRNIVWRNHLPRTTIGEDRA
jgi:cytochrome c553